MSSIIIKNVRKTYLGENNPAVSGFNLEIGSGEIITLLGPSGCGKTTTLRLIAGFEKPEEGLIKINNEILVDEKTFMPPEMRNIGMVFQDYALFPHLNIEENITFGLKKNEDRRKKVENVLELVGLESQRKKMPNELSGGQQQRVALARALVRNPSVILLDEPFSNLDADLRIFMRQEITRIIKEIGATAIFVTHDQKEALNISDKIVVMNNGKVEQIGTPREIYQFPKTSFVANFVGKSNIINGEITENKIEIETDIGFIQCCHDDEYAKGDSIKLSVRPESFEVSEKGKFTGEVKSFVYNGDSIKAEIIVNGKDKIHSLNINVHPKLKLEVGQNINFDISLYFVSIVK